MLIECLPGATVSKTDILPFILYDRNTLTSDTDKPSCFKKSDKKNSTEKIYNRGKWFCLRVQGCLSKKVIF